MNENFRMNSARPPTLSAQFPIVVVCRGLHTQQDSFRFVRSWQWKGDNHQPRDGLRKNILVEWLAWERESNNWAIRCCGLLGGWIFYSEALRQCRFCFSPCDWGRRMFNSSEWMCSLRRKLIRMQQLAAAAETIAVCLVIWVSSETSLRSH